MKQKHDQPHNKNSLNYYQGL